jgi:hypothetical protein
MVIKVGWGRGEFIRNDNPYRGSRGKDTRSDPVPQ